MATGKYSAKVVLSSSAVTRRESRWALERREVEGSGRKVGHLRFGKAEGIFLHQILYPKDFFLPTEM